MTCAGCSHEVGPRARFCEACGATLPGASTASMGAHTGSAPDSLGRVYAALPALIAFLQREGRVSYRALALVFNGDQAFLDAVCRSYSAVWPTATRRRAGWEMPHGFWPRPGKSWRSTA